QRSTGMTKSFKLTARWLSVSFIQWPAGFPKSENEGISAVLCGSSDRYPSRRSAPAPARRCPPSLHARLGRGFGVEGAEGVDGKVSYFPVGVFKRVQEMGNCLFRLLSKLR